METASDGEPIPTTTHPQQLPTSSRGSTPQNHHDNNIFFMTNGRRVGNGHVTPDELKTKLLEYKHQLNIVKDLYQKQQQQHYGQRSSSDEQNNIKEEELDNEDVEQPTSPQTPESTSSETTPPEIKTLVKAPNSNTKYDTSKTKTETVSGGGRIKPPRNGGIPTFRKKQNGACSNNNTYSKYVNGSESASDAESSSSTRIPRNMFINNSIEINSPKKSMTNSPKKSTTNSPKKSKTNLPRKSTTNLPKKLTTNLPRKSTTSLPKKSTTNSPKSSATNSPRHKTRNLPRKSPRDPSRDSPKHKLHTQVLNKDFSTNSAINRRKNSDQKRKSSNLTKPTALVHRSRGMLQRSDSDLSTCSNASSYCTDFSDAIYSDNEVQPRRREFKSRKPVARSRSSVEGKEIKTIYEQKFKELHDEMTKKMYLQDLSTNLKQQYFENLRSDLESKCERYEKHIRELEMQSRDHTVQSSEIELRHHKLEFENSLLCNEYNRLKEEKMAIERELVRCQEMLSQSFNVQKEVERCLEKVQHSEASLASKLKEVRTENEGLKHDLETLQTLCMENDERVKYYQQMETRLQECMNRAMLQISQLEKETMQSNVEHKLEFQKLVDQHEKLQKEHETMKILYSDALRRIEETTREKDELKRSIMLLRYHNNNKDIIYSNSSSRNHSPLSQTPVGSPGTSRKQYTRRTWFPHDIQLDQFRQKTSRQSSQNSSENDESNQRICDVICDRVKPPSTRFPPRSLRLDQQRDSLSSTNLCESDTESNVSISSWSSSVRSSTQDLLQTPDGNCPLVRQISSPTTQEHEETRPHSWYVSVGEGGGGLQKKPNEPQNRVHLPSKLIKPKPLKTVSAPRSASATPTKLKQLTSITSTTNSNKVVNNTASSKSKLPTPRAASAIPTPCNVARTQLTTEEVLAAVQQKQSPNLQRRENKPVFPTRYEQLCSYRDEIEAKEIVDLEQRLKELTDVKLKLDSQFGKIPTRSSSRSTRRSAQEESSLDEQYNDVTRELSKVRSSLKKLNAF